MIKGFVYGMRRYIVLFGVIAVVCGTIGCYISGGDLEPGEPIIQGIETLTVTDYYIKEREIITPEGVRQSIPLNPHGKALFELGRWSGVLFASLATASVILSTIGMLGKEIAARRVLLKGGDVIAIHGDSAWVHSLGKDLKRHNKEVVVASKDEVGDLGEGLAPLSLALKAPSQVLLFENDDEALEFLEKHADEFASNARVYVHLNEIVPEGLLDERVMPFSMAEICAQSYWDSYPVTRKERIVLIGEGSYAEALLYQGLITNLFDTVGGVQYDVIGDFTHWCALHPGWKDACEVNFDKLEFHAGEWSEHADLLRKSDRVILCGRGAKNIRIAAELQSEPLAVLHMRNDNKSSVRVLGRKSQKEDTAGPRKVEVFGTNEELCTLALVIEDTMHNRGRMCDIMYGLGEGRCNECQTYDFSGIDKVDESIDDDQRSRIRNARIERMSTAAEGCDLNACLSCPFFQADWAALSGFKRRSNYAIAAHDGQKFRLLHKCDIDVSYKMGVHDVSVAYAKLPKETKDELQEVEHMRWCRMSYLAGWTYAKGKKDERQKTHPDLVPYGELVQDQSKDADSYISLCTRISNQTEQDRFEKIWARP